MELLPVKIFIGLVLFYGLKLSPKKFPTNFLIRVFLPRALLINEVLQFLLSRKAMKNSVSLASFSWTFPCVCCDTENYIPLRANIDTFPDNTSKNKLQLFKNLPKHYLKHFPVESPSIRPTRRKMYTKPKMTQNKHKSKCNTKQPL